MRIWGNLRRVLILIASAVVVIVTVISYVGHPVQLPRQFKAGAVLWAVLWAVPFYLPPIFVAALVMLVTGHLLACGSEDIMGTRFPWGFRSIGKRAMRALSLFIVSWPKYAVFLLLLLTAFRNAGSWTFLWFAIVMGMLGGARLSELLADSYLVRREAGYFRIHERLMGFSRGEVLKWLFYPRDVVPEISRQVVLLASEVVIVEMVLTWIGDCIYYAGGQFTAAFLVGPGRVSFGLLLVSEVFRHNPWLQGVLVAVVGGVLTAMHVGGEKFVRMLQHRYTAV